MKLSVSAGRYAVCRLEADEPAPAWAEGAGFVSVTRTADELSVVCREERVPAETRAEHGFRLLKVAGPLDFALTGVLASLSGALAGAGVSLFAVSTFDTDYLLVRETDLDRALEALAEAGHEVPK